MKRDIFFICTIALQKSILDSKQEVTSAALNFRRRRSGHAQLFPTLHSTAFTVTFIVFNVQIAACVCHAHVMLWCSVQQLLYLNLIFVNIILF